MQSTCSSCRQVKCERKTKDFSKLVCGVLTSPLLAFLGGGHGGGDDDENDRQHTFQSSPSHKRHYSHGFVQRQRPPKKRGKREGGTSEFGSTRRAIDYPLLHSLAPSPGPPPLAGGTQEISPSKRGTSDERRAAGRQAGRQSHDTGEALLHYTTRASQRVRLRRSLMQSPHLR